MAIETLNKDELKSYIAELTGISVDEVNEEGFSRFIQTVDDDDDDNQCRDDDDDEVKDDDDGDDGEGEDEEDEFNIDQIDASKLDPQAQLLYQILLEERDRNKKKEIDMLIDNANVSDKYKTVLNRMVKAGMSAKDIKQSILDFTEADRSASRKQDSGIFLSRGKININNGNKTKQSKLGSKEYGKALGELYKNKMGVK